MDYDTNEINRLREFCMQKTTETNQKDRQLYNMAEDMGRQALHHNSIVEKQRETISTLRDNLRGERQKNTNLEEELHFTRKRILTHTRRSIPRRSKRARRRIIKEDDYESTVTACSGSDTEIEDEESTNIALIDAMMDLETAIQ